MWSVEWIWNRSREHDHKREIPELAGQNWDAHRPRRWSAMGRPRNGYPPLIARLAYAYVRTLLVLEALLFAASLVLHLSVFISGMNQAYAEFGLPLFRLTVILGVPVIAFVRDGAWKNQIKSCPKWMWKGALIVGVYAFLIAGAQMVFSGGASFSQDALAVSGFPLGFDAISVCILHSVLWSNYLGQSEVVRRAMHSVALVALGLIVFLAYRAGYLHHPRTTKQ